VGSALSRLLVSQGFQVIILSRNPTSYRSTIPAVTYASWNIEDQTADEQAFRKASHIIHLAGASVADKPWTDKRKKEIEESRTKSSALLVKMLGSVPNAVVSVVSASAIGWYKENSAVPAVENDPPDTGFLGETCRLWEDSILPVSSMGKRLVILRTGIVLSNEGGAFPAFAKPAKYGIAAILGNGKQTISWIHIDDLCRLYIDAMQNIHWAGVYNAVAPNPVTNRTFTLHLAKKMKGKFFIPMPVPSFVLRLMLGGRSEEILKSSNISAQKLKLAGFQFIYPTLDAALRQLVPR